jgi:hypothetical protein
MKVLHGACLRSFKQINKGMIKVFDTPYIKILQALLRKCFNEDITNQVDKQSNMKFQFNLDIFNVCCTQVHKTKYSMNLEYPILGCEIIWVPYHIF